MRRVPLVTKKAINCRTPFAGSIRPGFGNRLLRSPMPANLPRRLRVVIGIALILCLTAVDNGSFSQSLPDGDAPGSTPLADVLARRVMALRRQVEFLDGQIVGLQQRIPEVERRIDELIEEAGALTIPDPQSEAQEESELEPRGVPFRPPMLRTVQKGTPLAIVCTNNRAAILDLEEHSKEVEAMRNNQSEFTALVGRGGGTLNAGDFDIRWVVQDFGVYKVFRADEAIPKPGRDGESAEAAIRNSSKLMRRLREIDSESSVIQFAVYPDSFDVFRKVRAILWEREFGVNWIPLPHGEPIKLSGGGGGVGQQ